MADDAERRMIRLRELRVQYGECHRAGMAALERHDVDALDAAIKAEAEILREQLHLLAKAWRWKT